MRPFQGVLAALALVCSLLVAVPVWAHHSHGNYDVTQFTSLKGKVSEIHWNNPHSWIYLEVTNEKGETDVWALEGEIGRAHV